MAPTDVRGAHEKQILLVSLLVTLSAQAQQPADLAVANEYCDALIHKWDLLFEWARAAAPDIEKGFADLDAYAEKGRRLINNSDYPYEQRFLERAYLQAILVAVQLAMYSEKEIQLTAQLKAGARAQCIEGVLSTLNEVPLPPRL